MKTSILVDTNVLVDVMTLSSTWFEWSRAALKLAVERFETYFPAIRIISPDTHP